jgi:DNA-binding CsgD family transcriptional regulator
VRRFLREARERDPDGDDDPLGRLTYRERGVVRHIVDGRTNREIGEALGLAEKTVRNYVSNVLNKLKLDNRTQLAVHLARSLDRLEETDAGQSASDVQARTTSGAADHRIRGSRRSQPS